LTDFKKLKEAGIIALTDDGKGIQSDELFKKAMIEAHKYDLPILDHSEDEALSNKGAIHLGEVSKQYAIKGIDSRSESVHVERGCRLASETGCHYHVLHISTQESIKYVQEAKKKKSPVTCEVSPHHLLLCDEDIPEKESGQLDANWKMNPPLRSNQDREACIEALLDGTIDFIATDHAPHSPEEKNRTIELAPFGIIGLETAFPLMYTHFVKTNKITLQKLIELMSLNPSRVFKLKNKGLKVEGDADLVLIDLEDKYKIDHDFFYSKSKNSPFIDNEVYGRVKLTMKEGKIVYNDLVE
jgi:dihydroorotase